MLTYRLVQPSYAILKIGSMIGAVPFHVNVECGSLQPRTTPSSRFVLRIYRVILLLKMMQLLNSIVRLSQSVMESSMSLNNTVIAIIVLVLSVLCMVWSLEFEKHHIDLILLQENLRKVGEMDVGSFAELDDRKKNVFTRFCQRLLRIYGRVVLYLRAVYNDFARCFPTFSSHDILTIIVPVAIPSFLCVGSLCAILGEPEFVFAASLLNERFKGIWGFGAVTVLFDITVFTFNSMTCLMAFYGICATLAIYIPELKNLER